MWRCSACQTRNWDDATVCHKCARLRPDGAALEDAYKQAMLAETPGRRAGRGLGMPGPIPSHPAFRQAARLLGIVSGIGIGAAALVSRASFPNRELLWNPTTLADYMYGLFGAALVTAILAALLAEFSKNPERVDPGPTGVNPPEAFPGIALVLALLAALIVTARYIFVGLGWLLGGKPA